VDFAGQKARRMPATVSEKHRRHGGAESDGEIERRRLVEKRAPRNLRGATAQKAKRFEHADSGDCRERHCGLHTAPCAHAQAVDPCEQGERRRGDEGIADAPAGQLNKIAREGDCDGSHSARLDDE
jgi:hypothetical protein